MTPSVEIDTNRTTKITNSQGIANLNMMILRGEHDLGIAIVCECNGIKTSLSRKVTIENEVRSIKIMDSFDEVKSLKYNKDANGDTDTTPVKLTKSP